MRNLFFGMLACVAFTACSSDDAEVIEGGSGTFKGDVAYMNIILADASGTRANAVEDDPFEYGKDEQEVNTAHFYFYDAAGVFVSEAEVWNSGKPSTGTPDENIEFRANTTVVLKGLTGKSYPKYLVTVLNKSTDFAPGTTLDEMEDKIAANDTEGNFKSGNYFTMSTTSHAGQKNSEGDAMKYFVTEVKESNFSEEPVDLEKYTAPVVVYVERLAAKVVLNVAEALKQSATIVGEGDNAKTLYPIKATYAGEGNDEEPTMGVEELYVNILGWKLNATAKNSYMMKNIDETWTNEALGFVWNDGTINHRSYWGKSYVYGKSDFPVDGAAYTGEELLNYFNLENTTASPLLALGKPAYCAENTNTSYIVSHNPRRALTSVIMKAEIGRIVDKAGAKTFEPLDVVRYNGMLFEKIHFLKYVLNNLQKSKKLTAYYETSVGGETKLTQIDSTFVELADISDGKVKVVLKEKTGVTLVDKDGNTLSDEAKTALNGEMEKASAGATGYKGGLMYYNIPIEHYNNSENTEGTEEGSTTTYVKIPEAKYGVVRNHVYKVTINKLENPGKGIFDPEEVIVPKDEDEKFYYVGAQINILSWKIVNQGVNL